jgi:hypothetical protein
MTRKLAGLALSAALTAGLWGCGASDSTAESGATTPTDEFRNGVPRAETIRMAMPGDDGGQVLAQGQLEESTRQALLGETAEWYKTTRKVTRGLNGAALAVGGLVKFVLNYPPTTLADNQAVWGPWEDPLDPVAWKVTVTRVAAHTFQYTFEGRPKLDPNAAFVIVLAGTHTPALNARGRALARFGSGSFTLDWDARATLPQPDDNVGKVDYSYEHLSADDTVDIKAKFRQVKDEDRPGQKVDANYAFAQQPKGPGSMDFVFIMPPNAQDAGGRALVHSRWQNSGAGRADVQMKSLDGSISISENECWDTTYASVYLQDSWPGGRAWGSESSCAFLTAEYSTLQ